jgi:hypothetical protein
MQVVAAVGSSQGSCYNQKTQQLKSLVADLSMSNELLREKIQRMESVAPLVWGRWKP